ncbi:hypothetical protein [Flavobacterium sp.]|uniref:hypothetical protein n=1 Tax=Flavobacterium sp. TaxID=239 RepID=UPI0011FAB4CC|nr:hypothetical protein [Flavobacterium sp.]RZJ71896.1 MAG: hypothetical protein EOO49_07660 [Flavobacterium sp.]
MIAYDKELLENTFAVEAAEDLRDGKFISDEQYKLAKQSFVTLKTNRNIFLRIAFFLLGVFCYSAMSGTFGLMFASMLENFGFMAFCLAIIGAIVTEVLSRGQYFAHGLDDAAILGCQLWTGIAFGITTESPAIVCLSVSIVAGICALRYLHTLSVIVSVAAFVAFIGTLTFDMHVISEIYLTVILFVFAIVLFFIHRTLKTRKNAIFYNWPLLALEFSSLAVGYFSMNYFVVRTLAEDQMGFQVTPANDIPLAILFWIFTFGLPPIFVYFAIKTKNRLMLWVGILTLAFSIFSFRYYYHVLPTEWALLLGGLLVGAASLFCIRKLKGRETGVTFEKDRLHDSRALSVAQAVIVNSHAIQNIPTNGPMEFGGGGFSGGGAGESF